MKEEGAVYSVLVVDDDRTMRDVSRLVLRRSGRFTVVAEGADGLEGIDLASEHQPDIVLLDITMPGMDGFEALPHIRQVAPNSKVVVLTGLSGMEVRRKALDLGAAEVLEKDADTAKFLRNLLRVMEPDAPGGAAPPEQDDALGGVG